MRGAIVTLVILVILAGVVFYFGWVQILLPPETYAVIFTKTGGYDRHVTEPGKFTWRWERLIPTNMTIYRFDLHPQTEKVSFDTQLPSADLYSSVLPDKPSFTLQGQIQMQLRIKPQSLPRLVAQEKLTPETLSQYYGQVSQQAAGYVRQQALEAGAGLAGNSGWQKQLEQSLAGQFSDLEVLSLEVQDLAVPDLQLYRLARDSYQSLVAARDEARNAAAARVAQEQQSVQAQQAQQAEVLKTLGQYGELLTKYPVLLKAMYIDKLAGNKEFSVPEFDLSSILQESKSSGSQ